MGRYYNGDINGKFWFAVQNSDDASFFGGSQSEPNFINNYFDKEDLPTIEKWIKECKKNLGKYEKELNRFFKKANFYNDEQIAKKFQKTTEEIKELLTWYARIKLGEKIHRCVKKNGNCSFEAEI